MSRQSKGLNGNEISILREYVEGKISRAEASKQCGVSDRTIARWSVRYQTEGAAGFLPRDRNRNYWIIVNKVDR